MGTGWKDLVRCFSPLRLLAASPPVSLFPCFDVSMSLIFSSVSFGLLHCICLSLSLPPWEKRGDGSVR